MAGMTSREFRDRALQAALEFAAVGEARQPVSDACQDSLSM